MAEGLLAHYEDASTASNMYAEILRATQDSMLGRQATTALGALMEQRRATFEREKQAERIRSQHFNFLTEVQLEAQTAPELTIYIGATSVERVERVLGDLASADLIVPFKHNSLRKYAAWFPNLRGALDGMSADGPPSDLLLSRHVLELPI